VLALGRAVEVVVTRRDESQRRWVLGLRRG
jgi:hypothetical protein